MPNGCNGVDSDWLCLPWHVLWPGVPGGVDGDCVGRKAIVSVTIDIRKVLLHGIEVKHPLFDNGNTLLEKHFVFR